MRSLPVTLGLVIYNDSLFESNGSPPLLPWTRSVFGPVDLSTGNISIRVELDKEKYFGEGIASLDFLKSMQKDNMWINRSK